MVILMYDFLKVAVAILKESVFPLCAAFIFILALCKFFCPSPQGHHVILCRAACFSWLNEDERMG